MLTFMNKFNLTSRVVELWLRNANMSQWSLFEYLQGCKIRLRLVL